MTEKTELAQIVQAVQPVAPMVDYGFDVARVVAMRAAAEEVVEKVLRENEHYGVIPGTTQEGKKPKKVLLLPGAEVLCQVFRLRPEFHEIAVVERDDFIYYKIKCKLFHSVSGELLGEALGSANTREEKYTAQTAAKLCPECKQPTIFRSKKRPGDTSTTDPGWFCWSKKGGCGAEFAYEDKKLLDQKGTVSADKVWNLHHTILSQAQKRPYVRAVRNATGTSNLFTDEDVPPDDDEHGQHGSKPHARTQPQPSAVPKAGVTDVQKLTAALTAAQIGTAIDPQLPEAEYKELARKAKLAWVNGMLEDCGKAKVASALELTPEQIKDLIAKAERGQVPQGW
jgi:hypothetical protein